MPIALECHGCGQKLTVEDEAAGGKVQCPCCSYVMDVPARTKARPPAPDVAKAKPEPAPQPRRRRRKEQETTYEAFDPMERPHEPAVMRALDELFCLHPVFLFFVSVLLVPFAIIVLVVSNDREAVRNAGMVLFFAVVAFLFGSWIVILLKSWDALY
jgi:hypothetical protein